MMNCAGVPDLGGIAPPGSLLLGENDSWNAAGGNRVMTRILGYVAIAEAVSFLILLLAMVLKYGFDEPIGVEIMGPMHGALFLGFIGLAVIVGGQARWHWRTFAVVLASSVVPVAGWVVGHRLLQESAPAAA